ncbi:hypothetical protein WDZ92_03915 [Nostoc sp. NIES-2111]
MKRWLACLLCIVLLAPTMASAAEGTPVVGGVTGQEPIYMVLVPEEVAASSELLTEANRYAMPMGMERAMRGPLAPRASDPPVLGVPPFIWGLILSVPGVVVVRLHSQERSATQKALLGAGLNLAAFTVLYFTVFSPVNKGK